MMCSKSTFLLLPILISLNIKLSSQQFSILTCGSGDAIYSTFGHSAIRYQDSSQGIDWVYNYGLFEFSDPNFIPKFCLGKLDYLVGKQEMNEFMYEYVTQGREVREQILDLNSIQRDSLLRFLEWNIQDKNKYYRYDFLYNNCATKIVDIIQHNCSGVEIRYFKDSTQKSFRNLIHIYAENSVPWIDWGMDLALGTRTDRKISDKEYCFLPDYVFKSIDLSMNTAYPKQLVQRTETLIPKVSKDSSSLSFFHPHFFAILLALLCLYAKFRPSPFSRISMGILFILLGIGGIVIGFEWFFTEHTVTKNNFNLGWLNPLSIIYGIYLLRNMEANQFVSMMVRIGIVISLLAWGFQWQNFHSATKIILVGLFIYTTKITVLKHKRN